MEESVPNFPSPIPQSNPIPFLDPSVDISVMKSSVLKCSPELSIVDNDISDLLMDSFGIVPRNDDKIEDKFIEELDNNLPMLAEIFDDLQNAVKSENYTVKKNEAENLKVDSDTTMNP
jgi:hypothetical protein